MVLFSIILVTIGMLLLPLGRFYIAWQQKKNPEKFSDIKYVRRLRNTFRIVSLVLFVMALLLVNSLKHN